MAAVGSCWKFCDTGRFGGYRPSSRAHVAITGSVKPQDWYTLTTLYTERYTLTTVLRERRVVLETSTGTSAHTAINAVCAFKSAHHHKWFQEEYLSSSAGENKDTPFQMEINRLSMSNGTTWTSEYVCFCETESHRVLRWLISPPNLHLEEVFSSLHSCSFFKHM